jgi:flagellar biosynthesis/type III secretory pathway M-ring protein FliF/YscJ
VHRGRHPERERVAVALPGGPQEDLIRIARDNPATVANVVRNWVNA